VSNGVFKDPISLDTMSFGAPSCADLDGPHSDSEGCDPSLPLAIGNMVLQRLQIYLTWLLYYPSQDFEHYVGRTWARA
jgi:hypothetical protein